MLFWTDNFKMKENLAGSHIVKGNSRNNKLSEKIENSKENSLTVEISNCPKEIVLPRRRFGLMGWAARFFFTWPTGKS